MYIWQFSCRIIVMANNTKTPEQKAPKPDAALQRLNRLVGTWELKGHPLGSGEDSITGTAVYKWLHDANGKSFFLQQDMEMDYYGQPMTGRSRAIT